MSSPAPLRLVVQTREIDPIEDLLPFASASSPLAWMRRGDGMVGVGEVVRIEVGGGLGSSQETSRAAALAVSWRELARDAVVDDRVGLPGTGLVAFGALAFDEDSATASTLIVPRVVVGRRRGRAWVTRIRREGESGLEGSGLGRDAGAAGGAGLDGSDSEGGSGFGSGFGSGLAGSGSGPAGGSGSGFAGGSGSAGSGSGFAGGSGSAGSGSGFAGGSGFVSAAPETQLGPYWSGTLGPGSLGPDSYQDAVRGALAAIAAGTVEKVVLARDVTGTVPAGADLRRLVRALSSGYPDTWTYAVDGIVGASPETLVTVHRGTVTARVLAGTAPRGADADADAAASVALATSAKDLDEHEYAVQSVVGALRPLTSALAAAEQPFTLRLPNVWHLATDIEAELADGASALDLVATLHPTAAVAGTPTAAALELIRRLEPFDRGRYAGPVGWIDASGDGEWAIALRCAQFGPGSGRDLGDAIPVTAHAGAGIVAGSDPESELLETRVKFRPIVDALA